MWLKGEFAYIMISGAILRNLFVLEKDFSSNFEKKFIFQ